MNFHEHHFRNLGRARDHLTETMVSLQSAVDRMTGDDWIDAKALLHEMTEDIGPRLARLRTAASERFDEHTRHSDFERMRTGQLPFPDERLAVATEEIPIPPRIVDANPPELHGGLDAAMMAYEPDSPEFDDIQAYRYVSTGKRPQGWIPPIV
jgi:hypothetical protein